MFSLKNYSDFYKTIDSYPNSFFIGANTPSGFAYAENNPLDEPSLTKLYILKGGPGTGKSTMMKKLREYYESKGASVISYYCSSDPDSLDAIIIENNTRRIAIADGTLPHSLDAKLPGAVSELIDLGACWDSNVLETKRDRISELVVSKGLMFGNSKKYLSAANEVLHIIKASAQKGFEKEKAIKFICRLIASLPKQKASAESKKVITSAISMKGALRLSTFDKAKKLIAIEDFCNLSPIFFALLSDLLIKSGFSVTTSYTPFNDIYEIYLPVQDIAFVPARDGIEYSKVIRLSRFAHKEYFSSHKAKMKFNQKYLLELLSATLDSLDEAKKHHFDLEEIYMAAMDFNALDSIYENLLIKIEKKLLI